MEQYNIDECVADLKTGIVLRHSVSDEPLGSVVNIYSEWNRPVSGLSYVFAVLTGKDPLTLKEIESDIYRLQLDNVTRSGRIGPITHHGRYTLHYHAKMQDGELIEDFIAPEAVELNCPRKRPYVRYFQKPHGKYMCLTVESNCWRLLENNVWLFYNGHYQPLHITDCEKKEQLWYVPTDSDIRVCCAAKTEKYGLEIRGKKQ